MEMEAPSDGLLKRTYCEDGSLRFSLHPTKNLFRHFQSVWQFTKSETNEKDIMLVLRIQALNLNIMKQAMDTGICSFKINTQPAAQFKIDGKL